MNVFTIEEMVNYFWELKLCNREVNNEIKKTFEQWRNENSISSKIAKSMFSGVNTSKQDTCIVKQQEKLERKGENSKYLNRFFFFYYDKTLESLPKEIPDFFKIKKVRTEIDYLSKINIKSDQDMQELKNMYDNLSEEQKKHDMAEICKTLAIAYAKKANIFNRRKDSEVVDYTSRMLIKDESIKRFLKYTIMYNELVPENKQLVFGIREDENKMPVLDACLPGYTRFSLHMGKNIRQVKDLLIQTNKMLEKVGIYGAIPTNNLEDVYKKYPVELENFTRNTGIINRGIEECNLKYVKQLSRLSKKEQGIEFFSSFMYPDFNDREIFFLAEMSSFMKGDLFKTRDVLAERRKIKENSTKETSLRKQYLTNRLQKCETDDDKQNLIKQLYEYFEIVESVTQKDKVEILKSFCTIIKENSTLDKEILGDFIVKQVVELKDSLQNYSLGQKIELINSLDILVTADISEIIDFKNVGFEDLLELHLDSEIPIPDTLQDELNIQNMFDRYKEHEDFDFLIMCTGGKGSFPKLDDEGFEVIFQNLNFESQKQLLDKVVNKSNEKTPEEIRNGEDYLGKKNKFFNTIIEIINNTYEDEEVSIELINYLRTIGDLKEKAENVGVTESTNNDEQYSKMYNDLKKVAKQVGVQERVSVDREESEFYNEGKSGKENMLT